MDKQLALSHDVFISYSHKDAPWVSNTFVPWLEQAGLNVAIDYRDFQVGVPTIVNIEQAIATSRFTVLVLTPAWVADQWRQFESLLLTSADPSARERRLIPVVLEPCEIPKRIAMLTYSDLTQPDTREAEMSRLLRAMSTRARLFISYKRHTNPDEEVAKRLVAALQEAGHTVFIDHMLTIGVDWAREIRQRIEDSDFMIVLLSSASIHSEMVAEEIEHAYQHWRRTGKARLLPIRVHYNETLPYQLVQFINELQQAFWEDESDTERVTRQILDVITHRAALSAPPLQSSEVPQFLRFDATPMPAADPRFIASLRDPSGSVRLRSPFYIEREGDERLQRELKKDYGTTTTIRGPRQTGKTSLLIRGMAQAQGEERQVVLIDLQRTTPHYLRTLDQFLRYLVLMIAQGLHLDPDKINKGWRGGPGAPNKTTHIIEDYVLQQPTTNLMLAIDEADILLKTNFHDNFFGLLRSWHNLRAHNELWDRLHILMVISTESHLLISDVRQSPFNVGLKIALDDFTDQQVHELNRRYRTPLTEHQIPTLMAFLNGHPYLTRRALYTLLTERLTWDQLEAIACTPRSPFSDHLRHYLWLLHDQQPLRAMLKHIITYGTCPDEVAYYRLLQAGLIKGVDSSICQCRCRLYELFLKDKL